MSSEFHFCEHVDFFNVGQKGLEIQNSEKIGSLGCFNTTHYKYRWNKNSNAEGVSRYWGKSANQDMYFSCDLSTKITALTSKIFVLCLIIIEIFSVLNVLTFKIYQFACSSIIPVSE